MRKPIAWTVAALAGVAILVGVLVLVRSGASSTARSECTVPMATGAGALSGAGGTGPATPVPVYLDAVQLQHAATINAVGMARGLPARARVIALATAFQESKLRNLAGGDRDSVGLFQQRPSQGWGTPQQISDPVYAAGKFYDALVEVPRWQALSLTKAAQAVQRSAFPNAYAQWEGQALTLAAALGGAEPMALGCVAGALPPTATPPARPALAGTAGAPPALASLLGAAQAELGGLDVVGITGSTAVLSVTVPATSPAQAGRALAAWAVAHGTGFAVTAVSAGDQRWTDHRWATTAPAASGRVSITTG